MRHPQRGTVIVVTLWTVTLLTILVTVIASQVRLSARTAALHREDLVTWSALQAAVNQAEMELMLEEMPAPIESLDDTMARAYRQPRNRYNGQELQLSYPQAENIGVRIYEHAGKINLAEISRPRLRALLDYKLGDDADPAQIDAMMAAWNDWQDLNSQAGLNGAEDDYYGELDSPYTPRNGSLETVEELLLIRGFAEVFADVDLDAAFTLYGDNELVNLNVATVEAMRLLPGLTEELIADILAWRAENEFVGNGDVAQVVPAENMAQLRSWLASNKSTGYYTILAYRKPEQPTVTEETTEETTTPPLTAYAEVVQVNSFTAPPRVLKVNPYQPLPLIPQPASAEDADE